MDWELLGVALLTAGVIMITLGVCFGALLFLDKIRKS